MEIFTGILFAILWASAAIGAKYGLRSADPLALAFIRVMLAGPILLSYVYLIQRKDKLPKGKEWGRLFIFGFLNTTVYLACFATSSASVSAGLINLFIAINPLIIVMLSAVWLKRKVTKSEVAGLAICFSGLLIASIPALGDKSSSLQGILILSFGMIGYCIASVYYSKLNVQLSNVAINGWQVFIGGLALFPIMMLSNSYHFTMDTNLIYSLIWLVLGVSVLTMALWFYLLKKDTVKASQWLYLSPVAGYALSYIFLGEKITWYAIAGTMMVLGGLYVGKRSPKP